MTQMTQMTQMPDDAGKTMRALCIAPSRGMHQRKDPDFDRLGEAVPSIDDLG